MKSRRERLDVRLVELGLAESRARAQALILAGAVVVGDHAAEKAGQLVAEEVPIRLKGDPSPYASRGALKLERALEAFSLDPRGADALDVGASTGGFTDLLLQRGAQRVCAVDVGHGQLAWKLRSDPRVTSIEGKNARALEPEELPFAPECVTCDVSFISLTLVLPSLAACARERGRWMVLLVKPQFEAGRAAVGKGGVVRDEQARLACADKVAACALELGWRAIGRVDSPIAGPAGNVEILLGLAPAR